MQFIRVLIVHVPRSASYTYASMFWRDSATLSLKLEYPFYAFVLLLQYRIELVFKYSNLQVCTVQLPYSNTGADRP